jgi:hypothetical protein
VVLARKALRVHLVQATVPGRQGQLVLLLDPLVAKVPAALLVQQVSQVKRVAAVFRDRLVRLVRLVHLVRMFLFSSRPRLILVPLALQEQLAAVQQLSCRLV